MPTSRTHDDADASGMFRGASPGATRLSNFTASVAEDVTVIDEVAGLEGLRRADLARAAAGAITG